SGPPRPGPWQARRGVRPSPGTGSDRRKSSDRQGAGGGAVGRRGFRPLARLFKSDNRPARILLGADASEPELDRLAASGELGRFAFIHLATHGVIDEAVPARSAVILTQTGLPDPLEQVVNHKPVFDGRLVVRE